MFMFCFTELDGTTMSGIKKLRDVENPKKPLHKSYIHGACPEPLFGLTVPEALENAAKIAPNRKVVIFDQTNEELSFKEILERINDYAKSLLALGVQKGDCVTLVGFHDSDWIYMVFAALSIGAIFNMPYLYEPYLKDLEQTFNKTRSKYLFVSDEGVRSYRELFDAISSNQEVNNGESLFKSIPTVKHAFARCSDEAKIQDRGWRHFSDMKTLGRAISDEELQKAKSKVQIDDPAYIIFSSGSTGPYKAICWSQHILTNLAWTYQIRRNPEKKDMIVALQNPVFEEIFSASECIGAAVNINTIIKCVFATAESDNPETNWMHLACIEKYRCTHAALYPFIWAQLFSDGLPDKYDLSSLRAGSTGSIFMNEKFCEKLHSVMPEIVNIYGGSECMNFTMTRISEDDLNRRFGTVGIVMPHVEVKVIDEDGNIVAIGVEGEVCVRGWSTFLYYLNDEELTQKVKDSQGWYHSGDLCKMDEQGYLTYISRKSDCYRFKICGDVVYPQPIENTAKLHHKVQDAQVIGICKDSEASDTLYLCIIAREGQNLSEEEIKNFLSEKLTTLHHPDHYIFLKEFPKTGIRKKISKRLLTDMVKEMIKDREE